MRARAGRLSVVAAVFATWLGGCSGTPPGSSSATPPAGAVTNATRTGYDGALPPLPKVQFASARPVPVTRAAYEFAARHPEVLKHVPCFCGCERNGHGNNEDGVDSSNKGNSKTGEDTSCDPNTGVCVDDEIKSGGTETTTTTETKTNNGKKK